MQQQQHCRAAGDEGDVGHRDEGGRAEHQVVNHKCLPPRHRGQGRAAEGASRSKTEAQGAGLGVAVKGRIAEGATRSSTEAQGAGRNDKTKDEGAGRYKEVKSIRG